MEHIADRAYGNNILLEKCIKDNLHFIFRGKTNSNIIKHKLPTLCPNKNKLDFLRKNIRVVN
jgi:hypothetical protein